MNEGDDIRALRELLSGGAPARDAAGGIESAWLGLELPPVAPPPPGFAAAVVARSRDERRPLLGWLGLAMAPAWLRATAVLALALGVAGGAGLGWVAVVQPAASPAEVEEALPGWSGSTLAEDYLVSAAAGGVSDAATSAPSAGGRTP